MSRSRVARARAIPKYRKHKPSGRAVVTIAGRDHYLGPHGTEASHVEYDRLITEWLANGRKLADDDAPTVNELFVDYWDRHVVQHHQKRGEPTSRQHVIRMAMRPVHRLYGEALVTEFGPRALKACRRWMIDQGWARSTINDAVLEVRKVFRWGVENELVPADVWQALLAVRGLQEGRSEASEPDPVTPVPMDFVEAVRPFVARQVWAMIQLQLLTGMRPGEVVLMRPADVDTGGTAWVYHPSRHKTEHHGQAREVYLGPKAQRLLKPFLVPADGEPSLERFLFSPREAEEERRAERAANRSTPITPSQRARRRKRSPRRTAGERYTTTSYRRAVQRGVERANAKQLAEDVEAGLAEDDRRPSIPTWSPNQLRHNAGTVARREAGLETAQVLLGHRNADVTEVYAERDRERAVAFVLQHG